MDPLLLSEGEIRNIKNKKSLKGTPDAFLLKAADAKTGYFGGGVREGPRSALQLLTLGRQPA